MSATPTTVKVERLDAMAERLAAMPVSNIAVGEKPYVILHALDRDAVVDALATASSQVTVLREALEEQTNLVERLCDAVDREVENIGGEGSLTVLRLLGPANDRALRLLATLQTTEPNHG